MVIFPKAASLVTWNVLVPSSDLDQSRKGVSCFEAIDTSEHGENPLGNRGCFRNDSSAVSLDSL